MENDPLVKFLKLDPRRPALGQLIFACIGVAGGFSIFASKNIFLRRPFYAGIHQHILAATGLGYVGHQLELYSTRRYADRDAIIRHYVELHPEDFPPPEKQYYRDLLRPWHPVR